MHSMTSEGGAEDCSLTSESVQVDSGEPRRRLHANAERSDVKGHATGKLGRLPPPAPDEQRVTQQLVGAGRHRGLHAYQRAPERDQVVVAHGAKVRIEPRHRLTPRGPLLPDGLVGALLPHLLGVQLRTQLAILAVQLRDGVVARGGEAGPRLRRGVEESVEDGLDGGVAKGEGLAGGGEDDGGDVGATEDGELAGLLEKPRAALGEAHLTRLIALDAPDLDLLPPHARPAWWRHCCYLCMHVASGISSEKCSLANELVLGGLSYIAIGEMRLREFDGMSCRL